ncbi:MAG: bifunctional phosphopantothenoylcysteine decarboxylase/phosphopantothenate--cysteine ligase CoaBC [Cyclobacteriaceae bacterium]
MKGVVTNSPLAGKRILITAGPTHEPIDPVRFIGNHSSGKMGYALSEELTKKGAEVHLVSGPSYLKQPDNVHFTKVQTAQQMFEACEPIFDESDITILSAAVADYTPLVVADKKIKKEGNSLTIEFTKTIDIASTLGKRKKGNQLLIGFALETDNELQNAQNKLIRKNLDFIILNSLKDEGACFGSDNNKITILSEKDQLPFPLKSKQEVAKDIIAHIERYF